MHDCCVDIVMDRLCFDVSSEHKKDCNATKCLFLMVLDICVGAIWLPPPPPPHLFSLQAPTPFNPSPPAPPPPPSILFPHLL